MKFFKNLRNVALTSAAALGLMVALGNLPASAAPCSVVDDVIAKLPASQTINEAVGQLMRLEPDVAKKAKLDAVVKGLGPNPTLAALKAAIESAGPDLVEAKAKCTK